jgi:hypothetical protein
MSTSSTHTHACSLGRQRLNQGSNQRQAFVFTGVAPRAGSQRLGPPTPRADRRQHPAHRRAAHRHAGVPPCRLDQQVLRPRRPAVKKVARRKLQHPPHRGDVHLIHLRLTVVLTAVDQSHLPRCLPAMTGAADGRGRAAQCDGDAPDSPAVGAVDHDQVADTQVHVIRTPRQPQQPWPLPPTQYHPPCFHVAFLSLQRQLEWNATFTFTVRFARGYLGTCITTQRPMGCSVSFARSACGRQTSDTSMT